MRQIKLYNTEEKLPIDGDGATGYLHGRNETESLLHNIHKKNQLQKDQRHKCNRQNFQIFERKLRS